MYTFAILWRNIHISIMQIDTLIIYMENQNG